jgi:RNA polymerase sigma factor (sigma-70 family)
VNPKPDSNEGPEARFRRVFEHLQPVADYAARRGSPDPEAIAAETMAIAWRRLDRVPADDPRPWLFVTARNLLMAERRRDRHRSRADRTLARPEATPAADSADPAVTRALRALSDRDREALLLVAWDDLTPAQAAEALGIAPVAFRVRLLRARRRFARSLAADALPNTPDVLEVKST